MRPRMKRCRGGGGTYGSGAADDFLVVAADHGSGHGDDLGLVLHHARPHVRVERVRQAVVALRRPER